MHERNDGSIVGLPEVFPVVRGMVSGSLLRRGRTCEELTSAKHESEWGRLRGRVNPPIEVQHCQVDELIPAVSGTSSIEGELEERVRDGLILTFDQAVGMVVVCQYDLVFGSSGGVQGGDETVHILSALITLEFLGEAKRGADADEMGCDRAGILILGCRDPNEAREVIDYSENVPVSSG